MSGVGIQEKNKLAKRKMLVADILGWVGAVCLLSAYGLVSFGAISSDTLLYQVLNIIAAIGLFIDGIVRKAFPSAATNAVWLLIAIIAIIAIIL